MTHVNFHQLISLEKIDNENEEGLTKLILHVFNFIKSIKFKKDFEVTEVILPSCKEKGALSNLNQIETTKKCVLPINDGF